jgi:hypothetical protein
MANVRINNYWYIRENYVGFDVCFERIQRGLLELTLWIGLKV